MAINIKIEKIDKRAITPKYAHETDSGFDLYTCYNEYLKPGETKVLPTGIRMEMPPGYGVTVRPRSGNTLGGVPNCKVGCKIRNARIEVHLGTIDEGYRGVVGIIATNNERLPVEIPMGTKLAQGVVERVDKFEFEEVKNIDADSDRGCKGFGSTDR